MEMYNILCFHIDQIYKLVMSMTMTYFSLFIVSLVIVPLISMDD